MAYTVRVGGGAYVAQWSCDSNAIGYALQVGGGGGGGGKRVEKPPKKGCEGKNYF